MVNLPETTATILCNALELSARLFAKLLPLLKQRHTALTKETRALIAAWPSTIDPAAKIAGEILGALDIQAAQRPETTPSPTPDIDPLLMRNELENVTALVLPDLDHEMQCLLGELPALHDAMTNPDTPPHPVARIAAWSWEAGRRYGLIEAIALLNTNIEEFGNITNDMLETARDRNLDLPAPEPTKQTGEVIPFKYPTAEQVEAEEGIAKPFDVPEDLDPSQTHKQN